MMSSKPSKSRKAFYTHALHHAVKHLAAHLSESLAKELGKRSMTIRKGDTVKIMRGAFAGKEGKVTSVAAKTRRIFIEKITKKKSNGSDWQVPLDASKVMVIDVDRSDRKRFTAKKGVKA